MSYILIVDDEEDIRALISDILQDEGFATRTAANATECFAAIAADPPALMILDIWLKDSTMDGIEILKATKHSHRGLPVVIISGHGNIEIAVAAIKQGAYDFIEKPFNIDQLMVVVTRAMETSKLRRENDMLRRKDVTSSQMVGQSTEFRALVGKLKKVINSNSRVLLKGPPGAGKEIAARYIHTHSNRSHGPFVCVNSASIEPEKMEVVLFGRETADRGIETGLLEQAHGGVLYFDEIADMPLVTQSKILRVLVEQQFTRVGGQDKIRVDARVISSSCRDLQAEMRSGRFREELYHRLNVVPIEVPGLEQRSEDIPELASYFIEFLNKTQGLPLRALSEETRAHLQTLRWPGNIRQLRNVIERVLILGDDSGPISPDELPNARENGVTDDTFILSNTLTALPLREARDLFEKHYLVTQINRFGGNVSRTASFVGMERSALHRKLKLLGVATGNRSASAR